MDEQLNKALTEIPINYNIYIYPGVATYPKSTEVINYIIKETPSYKKRLQHNRCLITRDLEKDLIKGNPSAIILVDDFIGSGGSFEKGYIKSNRFKGWNNSRSAAFVMLRHKQFVISKPYLIEAHTMDTSPSVNTTLYLI